MILEVAMKRISEFIVIRKKVIFIFFIIALIVSAFLQFLVKINTDLREYLPSSSPSTLGLNVMNEEFKEDIPNLRVYIPDLSITEALDYKNKLLSEPEVKQIIWLDDVFDIKKPISFAEKSYLNSFYKDGSALYQVFVDSENPKECLLKLRALLDDRASFEGQFVDFAKTQSAVSQEVIKIMAIMIPLGLLILMFSTHSWLEPFVLLISIVVAIILNMGTNIFLGEVSFITQAIMAILQLAVSMDYAIFLLDKFNKNRKENMSIEEAMKNAISKSSKAIVSSAATTVLGFIVLVFMRFKIGPDMGIVLAKGVFFSLFSVVFFLPVVIIYTEKWIEKTTHRSFLPSFKPIGKIVYQLRYILPLILIITIPAFLAQKNNDFMYGMKAYDEGSREYLERKTIRDKFGSNIQMVLLVPKGNYAKEVELDKMLNEMPRVRSIISYASIIGPKVPADVIDNSKISNFISEHYSRIIINADVLPEGETSFEFVEKIKKQVSELYDEDYHLIGENVVNYDMKDIVTKDNILVNILAVISVGLVIMIAFRSLSIPVILVLTIKLSIWINLSFAYFTSTTITYMGYLVISSVQLGATVDYAILFTNEYFDKREIYNKKDSLINTIGDGIRSVLPPAAILAIAGYVLKSVSSLSVVSELGEILGRGAILSFLMVIFLLPSLLYILEPIIKKSTLRTKFRKER